MNPILQVTDLKKYFHTRTGTLHAVDGINFTIEPGKTLGVVGESGCGKTTLGRTILHLTKPTSGEIVFDGKEYKVADNLKIYAYDRANRSLDDWTGSQLASYSKKLTGNLYGVFKSDKDQTLVEIYVYASAIAD